MLRLIITRERVRKWFRVCWKWAWNRYRSTSASYERNCYKTNGRNSLRIWSWNFPCYRSVYSLAVG